MNVTIARITARALFGRRRFLLLLPLPALLIVLALISESRGAPLADWGDPVIVGLGLGVVLPVIALVVGTGVLGSEIDDGTIAHILAKPVSRAQIVFSKLLVAIAVTFVTTAVPLVAVAVIGGSGKLAVGLAVGAFVGSVAYSALFVALSLLTRRPVLLGLIYVQIWEGLLGNFLEGTQALSIKQYVIVIADRLAPSDVLAPTVSVPTAVVLAVVVAAGATVVAIRRLRSFSLVGETS